MSINQYSAGSGRLLKENNNTINIADILDDVYDDANGVLKTSASINVESLAITEVAIKDGSSTNKLKVNANGSIDANVTGVTITGVSTEAKQDTIIGHIDGLETLITDIKDTAGIKKITDPLPEGTNNLGSVTLKDSSSTNALKINANGSIDANVTGVTISGVSTEAKQDAIIGYVDGIETLLTSIKDTSGVKKITDPLPAGSNNIGSFTLKDAATSNALKVNANGSIDANVTGVTITGVSTEAKQDTIISHVDGLESLVTSIKNTDGIKKITDPLPSGTNNIGKVGYTLKKITASFTRPSDTNAYAVGDAITSSTTTPSVIQFDLSTLGAVAGQSLEIRKVSVVSSAKQATLPFINVFLSETTFNATNDNSALSIDDTTMESGGAWFDCTEQNYTALNSRVELSNTNCPIILANNDTKLYGTLQAGNAYTPVSAEKFTVILWIALL